MNFPTRHFKFVNHFSLSWLITKQIAFKAILTFCLKPFLCIVNASVLRTGHIVVGVQVLKSSQPKGKEEIGDE